MSDSDWTSSDDEYVAPKPISLERQCIPSIPHSTSASDTDIWSTTDDDDTNFVGSSSRPLPPIRHHLSQSYSDDDDDDTESPDDGPDVAPVSNGGFKLPLLPSQKRSTHSVKTIPLGQNKNDLPPTSQPSVEAATVPRAHLLFRDGDDVFTDDDESDDTNKLLQNTSRIQPFNRPSQQPSAPRTAFPNAPFGGAVTSTCPDSLFIPSALPDLGSILPNIGITTSPLPPAPPIPPAPSVPPVQQQQQQQQLGTKGSVQLSDSSSWSDSDDNLSVPSTRLHSHDQYTSASLRVIRIGKVFISKYSSPSLSMYDTSLPTPLCDVCEGLTSSIACSVCDEFFCQKCCNDMHASRHRQKTHMLLNVTDLFTSILNNKDCSLPLTSTVTRAPMIATLQSDPARSSIPFNDIPPSSPQHNVISQVVHDTSTPRVQPPVNDNLIESNITNHEPVIDPITEKKRLAKERRRMEAEHQKQEQAKIRAEAKVKRLERKRDKATRVIFDDNESGGIVSVDKTALDISHTSSLPIITKTSKSSKKDKKGRKTTHDLSEGKLSRPKKRVVDTESSNDDTSPPPKTKRPTSSKTKHVDNSSDDGRPHRLKPTRISKHPELKQSSVSNLDDQDLFGVSSHKMPESLSTDKNTKQKRSKDPDAVRVSRTPNDTTTVTPPSAKASTLHSIGSILPNTRPRQKSTLFASDSDDDSTQAAGRSSYHKSLLYGDY